MFWEHTSIVGNSPKETKDNVKMNPNHHPNSKETTAPRILLAETSRWPSTALLALDLAKAGSHVSAVCPTRHPMLKTGILRQTFHYSSFRPLKSLSGTIEATNPDFIIPCDDRAVEHLHELHAWARGVGASGNKMAALIEKSLGSPESYPTVGSRCDLLGIAREEGLRVPDTEQINSESDLKSWRGRKKFPWVMKADGTYGGHGVKIAHTLDEAGRFLLELTRYYGAGRAIKRLCVDRDPFWLRPWWKGLKPAVIVQSYIHGLPANCGVVCWKGKVLAGVGVEVVGAAGATGPSAVVRVVDNPDMMLCAERIAGRLGFSGFFGLDFMIEEGSGLTYLIEMNPRPTRVCRLQLGKGRDQVGALCGQLSNRPVRDVPPVTQNRMIAYFPDAWDSRSEFLESSFHDIPEAKPELLEELRRPWPTTSLLWRLLAQVDCMKSLWRGPDPMTGPVSKSGLVLGS
jgi:hypothetical protein